MTSIHRLISVSAVSALLLGALPAVAEEICEDVVGAGGRGHCAVRKSRAEAIHSECAHLDSTERGLCMRQIKAKAWRRGTVPGPVRRAVGRRSREACAEFERGSDALRDCLKRERRKIQETHPRLKAVSRMLRGRTVTTRSRSGGRARRFVRDAAMSVKKELQSCRRAGDSDAIRACVKAVRDKLRMETGANP